MLPKKILVLFMATVLLVAGLTACTNDGGPDVVVGGKTFSEQFILANMLSILIEENTDLTTEVTTGLGTKVLFDAVVNDEVDLYAEYTGTALMAILDMDLITDPEEVYQVVSREYQEQFGLKMLEPLGFNNSNASIVRPAMAAEYGLETDSDLAPIADQLILGCSQEFGERPDGYPGYKDHYGFEFRDVRAMDPSLMYTALVEEAVDVISGYTTDGRIAAFGLKVLDDDKDFFPPYYAAPVIRGEILEEHPELEDLLNQLAGRLDEATMSALNSRVDLDKEEPEDVARDFLEQEGLI